LGRADSELCTSEFDYTQGRDISWHKSAKISKYNIPIYLVIHIGFCDTIIPINALLKRDKKRDASSRTALSLMEKYWHVNT
jgi:hypothetical protein